MVLCCLIKNEILTDLYHSVVMLERKPESTPFARNRHSWRTCIQLYINLRMPSPNFRSSLHNNHLTMHRTTFSCVYTTGTLWMRYSALLRCVSCDFCIDMGLPDTTGLGRARCFPGGWAVPSRTIREEC